MNLRLRPIRLRLTLAAMTCVLIGPAITRAESGRVIPGHFIVVLRNDVSPREFASEFGIVPKHQYKHTLNGFAGSIAEAAIAGLMKDSRVQYVEPDQVITADTSQLSPPWGLDRIDQVSLPLNQTFNYASTGLGVNAYIIDTGIRYTHTQFQDLSQPSGTRASFGFDAIGDGKLGADCNGHGTHVAGTVAGSTFGIAKRARLVAVRVLDCSGSGTTSGVIAGVDWVAGNRQLPAVANMSLGGAASTVLDSAVSNLIASGVATAVAAGNSNADACKYSPSRVAAAMTVAASDSKDYKASFSNYGKCVDWFAPGVSIQSSWHTSDTATNTLNGTSMASPHTAGVAAQYLETNPGATPSQVQSAIFSMLSLNKIILPKGMTGTSKNLLFSGY